MPSFNGLRKKLTEQDMNEANALVANPYTQKKTASKLESGARGAAQGLSMGYADELTGALGAGKDLILGDARDGIAAAYRKNRDESRESYKQAESDNPLAYRGGQAAGILGSFAIPGLGALRGVKAGAALGALGGLGHSGADLTQGEVVPAAKDAALGAGLGAVGGKVAEKVIPRFQGLMQKVKGAVPETEAAVVQAAKDEAFRKTLNPDLYEAQASGKISASLKGKSDKLTSEIGQLEAEQAAALAKEAEDAGFKSVEAYMRHLKQQQLERIRLSGSSSGKIDIPTEMVDTPTKTIP